MSGFLFEPDIPYKSPISLLEKPSVIMERKSSNGRSYNNNILLLLLLLLNLTANFLSPGGIGYYARS
jgi:hypothetical protein